MRTIVSKYGTPFKWYHFIIAFIIAVSLHILGAPVRFLLEYSPRKSETTADPETKAHYTPVIHGFENIDKHRIFAPPASPFDKRVLLFGACNVSTLYWHYWPGGQDLSGRSSIAYNLEKVLHQNPRTKNLYVYNLGMEGTGYVEALYFLLSVLEQPNIGLVVFSISQEGDNHIPNNVEGRYETYSRFLPKLQQLLEKYLAQYPEIKELKTYLDYVAGNSWTKKGMENPDRTVLLSETVANEAYTQLVEKENTTQLNLVQRMISKIELYARFHPSMEAIAYNSIGVGNTVNYVYRYGRASYKLPVWPDLYGDDEEKDLKPVEWYLKNFRPRKYPIEPRKYARYDIKDRTVLRLMGKLLGKKGIDLWIINPPDLAVAISPLVHEHWWLPLTESLKDLPNVKAIDISKLPMIDGTDLGGRVAPTYYGVMKQVDYLKPLIEKWSESR